MGEQWFLIDDQVAKTDQSELADKFLAYVMSPEFQTLIPKANWSLPSALPQDQWPDGWSKLPLPEKVLFYNEDEAATLQGKAIEAWRSALTQ